MKSYNWYDKKKCRRIVYNYYRGSDDGQYGEEYSYAEIGKNGVVDIQEKPSCGEGDKWFFDIVKDDGTVERVFNPHQAFYYQEEMDKTNIGISDEQVGAILRLSDEVSKFEEGLEYIKLAKTYKEANEHIAHLEQQVSDKNALQFIAEQR
jgi:hypothetical protein